jgi:hypothetical protein
LVLTMKPSNASTPRARAPALRRCGALLLLALAAPVAFAALEQAPSDLPAARVQRTPATTSAGVAYTDISRTLKSGTLVHEYADATGAVFAVTWSGPFKPDLKRLLGRYFDTLGDGTAARQGRRSRIEVNTGDLVVQSGGHMGAFEGRAWVQSHLPAGFDPQEMK